MGLFDLFKDKTDVEERAAKQEYSYGNLSITSFFNGGDQVTEDQAMKIPAVASSVELISSSIGQLPVYLYKQEPNGEIRKIEDRRVFLINQEPNELVNGVNFKKSLVKDYLFHGASYTKVEKVRNDVIALYNLPTSEISVTKYKIDSYKYHAEINLIHDSSGQFKTFQPHELIMVLKDSHDGVTSQGILKTNADTFRLAIDEQDYSIGILKNGALPIGVLKATSRLTDSAINRLRTSFENLYGGPKKAGKTLILEEGLDYNPISMKPNEMDLTNSRKNTTSEIARIFNVPLSMIDSSANKYASNEQNNIHFLQYCISPIVSVIENSLDRTLLLESEKEQGYYFRFDTSEILRTTEREKIESVVRGMEKGIYSINEARGKVDLPNLETDYFTWTLGSVFFNPKTGNMTIPNMGMTLDPDNLQPPAEPIAPTKDEPSKEDESDEEANEPADKKEETKEV